jgi:hypothetical protein
MDMSVVSKSILKLAGFGLAAAIAFSVPASAKTVAEHGYWSTSEQVLDGSVATMARTEIDDGSIAAFILTRNEIRFRAQDDGWSLRAGQTTQIRITVDGEVYRGTATAVNDTEFETSDLSVEFLKKLINSREAVVEVGGDSWRLNLNGLAASLGDAITRYQRRASSH